MGATTIKVSKELRDRLREEADREDVTLGALLGALLEERARARRFDELREAIASTPDAELATWSAETEAWHTAVGDGLGS